MLHENMQPTLLFVKITLLHDAYQASEKSKRKLLVFDEKILQQF